MAVHSHLCLCPFRSLVRRLKPPLTKCRSTIDMHEDVYLPAQQHMQPSITDYQCTASGADIRLPLDSISSTADQKQIATAAKAIRYLLHNILFIFMGCACILVSTATHARNCANHFGRFIARDTRTENYEQNAPQVYAQMNIPPTLATIKRRGTVAAS